MRTKVSAYYEFFMGTLGPAVSFKFGSNDVKLKNTDSGGQVEVDLGSNQQMVAGLGIGFVVGAGVNLSQEIYAPGSWYSPWKFKWRTLYSLSLKFDLDFIKLLLSLIQYLLEQSVEDGLLSPDTGSPLTNFLTTGDRLNLAGSFLFYDYSSGKLGPDDTISATPQLTIPIDIIKFTPETKALVQALAALVGDIQFEPQLSIQMPVTLELDSFTVRGEQVSDSDPTYKVSGYFGSTVSTVNGPIFSTPAKRLSTNVKYSSSFTLGLSYFFKLSLIKVFSISITVGSLDMLNLLGLKILGFQATGANLGADADQVPGVVDTQTREAAFLCPS